MIWPFSWFNAVSKTDAAELFTGIKAFSFSPTVPNPVAAGDAANKRYVDGKIETVRAVLQDAMDGHSNVLDFGATGDGKADDTMAFQSAIGNAIATGSNVTIPAGVYLITRPLIIDQSAMAGEAGHLRPSIIGDGRGVTTLRFTGSGACLSYIGSQPGIYAENTIKGFRIEGGTVGLSVKLAAWMTICDLSIVGCDTGLLLEDVLCSSVERCYIGNNRIGVNTTVGSVSRINAVTFRCCEISHNAFAGVRLVCPSSVNFAGGAIQDNGNGKELGGYGVRIDNSLPFQQGAWSASFRGVYFEMNYSKADIWYDGYAGGCRSGLLVQGCNFVRFQNNYVAHAILVESGDKIETLAMIEGNGFVQYGGVKEGEGYIATTGNVRLSNNGLNNVLTP